MRPCANPQEILAQTKLVPWFLEFVQIDTQSDATSESHPSTAKQLKLQDLLREKLTALGGQDIKLDDKGYLYATFPGNAGGAPTIGLMAHVDTAPDFSGANVKAVLHEKYDGGPIKLANDVTISPDETPELKKCAGDTIITASGDTLLGADDKAGVAEILAALEYLTKHPDLPRPTVRVAFTPDEEIGQGAEFFDVAGFGAKCAYTVDGGFTGEVNFETFSADKAEVIFTGVAVHPGYAKDRMVNALRHLGAFLDRLPKDESPERTEKRQGFFHPTKIEGNAAEAKAEMILRAFDNDELAERGRRVQALADEFVKAEPRLKVKVNITKQYRNMADKLKEFPQARDHLLQAVRDAGLEPDIIAIRGGTDGSGLTAMGLPTPNIFTGGVSFHGPREWISTRVMGQAVCVLVNLIQRWAEK
jgi:tripeptide aminopeptidase